MHSSEAVTADPVSSQRLFLGVRRLASLNLPGACPGCFWVETHCRGKFPYQFPVPSVVHAADQLVKEIVHRCLEREERLPDWMPVLGEVAGYVPDLNHKWYRRHERSTNITLCGVPDDIFVMASDRTLHLVDYKAARFTRRQEEIIPLYEAQLNLYAFIARCKDTRRLPGPITELTLIFLEPQMDLQIERRLSMRFRSKALAVPLWTDGECLELFEAARAILDQETAPPHWDHCQQLNRMDRLMWAQTGDPFVALFGRYGFGRCVLCEEEHFLAPDTQCCFLCLDMETW